jgi:hypothetical protein
MTEPPSPPHQSRLTLNSKKDTLRVQQGLSIWQIAAVGAVVQVYDGTSQRVTATRRAALGPFAGMMKKTEGDLIVAVTSWQGETQTVQVPAKRAAAVKAWAFAFNAWSHNESAARGIVPGGGQAPPLHG